MDDVGAVVALLSGLVSPSDVADIRALDDGTYNAAWWLDTHSMGPLVVKVAPSPSLPHMTYERELMTNEAAFYGATEGRGLALPARVGAGSTWLALQALPGRTLISMAGSLTETERFELDRQLGAFMAGLHQVRGTTFGYGHLAQLQARTWPDALGAMFDALLADAARFDVELPVGADRLRGFLERLHRELQVVTEASLVHFDLWGGNALVDGGQLAVIDPERSFWGDPVAEFVSPGLFVDLSSRPGLFAGYGSGHPLEHPSAQARLLLYSCYLFTIMYVETTPRNTVNPGMQNYIASKLVGFADALEDLLR